MMNRPLGLPVGTVRAILALSIIGVTLAMWFLGKNVSSEQLALTSMVGGVYFGARTQNGHQ